MAYGRSMANIRSLTSRPILANTSDTIFVASCSSAGVMYSSLMRDTGPALVVMSSLPTNLEPILVQSMNGCPIEVVEHGEAGGRRLTIVGPWESKVLIGTTDMPGSTLAAPGRYSSGSTYPATYGYKVDEGYSIGNLSSWFTDEAAQAEITVCNTCILTSYSTLAAGYAGGDGGSAGNLAATVLSTNVANIFSTMFNHATSGVTFNFNEAASSACKKLNLYYTALCNVGILTST